MAPLPRKAQVKDDAFGGAVSLVTVRRRLPVRHPPDTSLLHKPLLSGLIRHRLVLGVRGRTPLVSPLGPPRAPYRRHGLPGNVLVLRARGASGCYSDLVPASSVFGPQALSLRESEDDGLYWGFAPAPSLACLRLRLEHVCCLRVAFCFCRRAPLDDAHAACLHAL